MLLEFPAPFMMPMPSVLTTAMVALGAPEAMEQVVVVDSVARLAMALAVAAAAEQVEPALAALVAAAVEVV